jgi:hypothetical protein
MNISLFKKDYALGMKAEDDLLKIFCDKFGEVERTTKKSTPYDYLGSNVYIELKTRRNIKNQYPTTMVGKNKLDWASGVIKTNPETKIYFCFNFTDGVYYWEYTADNLLDITFREGGRWDRGKPEIKTYAYIPVNKLISIV